MTVELTNEELKMIEEALWFYMSENYSMNANLIVNIMDKIEKEII
jgi:hypothetical protein